MNLLEQLFPSGLVLGPPLAAFFNDPIFTGKFVDSAALRCLFGHDWIPTFG